MGRAIVRDPKVFLFDEPLSNLDAKLRVAMRTEIKALHQRLKTTTVYVTHDQIEAMTMAGHAADGRRVRYGIRPEHLEPAGSGIPAEVIVVEPMGAETEIVAKVGDASLTVMMRGRASAGPGERIFLAPQAMHAHLFDAASGQRI
jgi:multiple sugar transport system ATP-binding protein